MDVCQKDANLIALGGDDKAISIFDRRQSKICKTLGKFHSSRKFHYFYNEKEKIFFQWFINFQI